MSAYLLILAAQTLLLLLILAFTISLSIRSIRAPESDETGPASGQGNSTNSADGLRDKRALRGR